MLRAAISLLALLVMSVAAPLRPACGQSFPDREINLVVPLPAGAQLDSAARAVAKALAAHIGHNVRVSNYVGAGGITGTARVIDAPPDGYTLLVADLRTLVLLPGAYRLSPYDVLEDLGIVALVARYPFVLVAAKNLPYNTLTAVIAAAKAHPGTLTLGNGGAPGGTSQIFGAAWQAKAGIKLKDIDADIRAFPTPDLMFAPAITASREIGNQRVKAIAVASSRRDDHLPQVPTFAEGGDAFVIDYWIGIFAPKRIPPEAVARIQNAITAAGPELAVELYKQGLEFTTLPADRLADFIKNEHDRWYKVIRDANIRAD